LYENLPRAKNKLKKTAIFSPEFDGTRIAVKRMTALEERDKNGKVC
jgi:hypothetical protein